jgi:hypothetical protein
MPLRIPYNQLPNLGALESGDIIPGLRPAFEEGSMTVGDLSQFVKPYKVYRVNLSQTYLTDPVINYVWENEIGNIVWTYNGVGNYYGTLAGAFTGDVPELTRSYFISVDNEVRYARIQKLDDDTIWLKTQNSDFNFSDNILNQTFIEIYFYPIAP